MPASTQIPDDDVHNHPGISQIPDDDVHNSPIAQAEGDPNIPEAVSSQLENANVTSGSPSTGANKMGSIASVDADSPDTININDPKSFSSTSNSASQTLAHEATHLLQNNLPPTEAAKIPADDANHPYDLGDLDAQRAKGKTITQLPREQEATIVQKYVASGGKDKALKPWVDDLKNVKLSTILPTKPGQQGISTTARAPQGGQQMLEDLPTQSAPKGAIKKASWKDAASSLGRK